ncbi:response regulator [Pseudoduganella ginsengisoli]|uniref:Response regulator n=1 Tax=Pseudoduganella ginsengisoli TaxID=1462440 RepID=A0A6L6Q753_9BURK|nr:response regulator [Pseudoduganella ginsengisoli]MTW05597.1 response regulator [Pseudoduganella ginsengisoli]
MAALNALVVDDSIITTDKLVNMLTELGHNVLQVAGTGQEALAAYRQLQPDFVTMDITMPDMDGVQATRLIVEEFPHANIIMATSHGQEKMVLAAIDAGARGYILKPIRKEKLQESIAKVMRPRA